MGLKKGQTNNPKGRPAGVPNKLTKNLRAAITEFLEGNFLKFQEDMESVEEPRDRAKLYLDLMQYGIPKLQAVSMKTDLQKMLTQAQEEGTLTDDHLKRLSELIVEQLKSSNEDV